MANDNAATDDEQHKISSFFAAHPRLMGAAFALVAMTGQAVATGTPAVNGP